MGDAELEAIRQRRMAELMQQQQMGGAASSEEQQVAEARRAKEAEERMALLAAILLPEARERLSRIGLVKPEKSRAIEDMIIHAARRGSLTEKVTEERLIELLEQVNEQSEQRKTTVTIQRRRMAFDSDEDDF